MVTGEGVLNRPERASVIVRSALSLPYGTEPWLGRPAVRSFDQISTMGRIVPAGFVPHLRRKERRDPSRLFGQTQIGMFDEAIRTVMISLKQANGGKLPHSIAVTSAHSGEGKSLVAGSLAIELAANGTPVLLVDSDIRRGHLDTLFRSGLLGVISRS